MNVTDKKKQETLIDFITRLYAVYADLHFAYVEINPLICLDGVNGDEPIVQFLDMAAQLDKTAGSICGPKWAIARDVSVGPALAVSANPPERSSALTAAPR